MPTTRAAGRESSERATLLLLALAAALLLFRLGSVPLVGPDEPRYARVAVEMYRSGDRVTPTLQGVPWLEKPALYYWLAGMAYSVLGETEAAARLPSVVAGLLLVVATTLVGGRLYGRAAGLHAGFILATSVLVFAYGRAATMDMLVAATITAAVGLFAIALLGATSTPATIPMAYVFMALATLAKGPIGFLLPGLVLVGYVLATREWRLLRRALSPAGIALFLLVAGPWYLAIYRAQGQAFVDVFLLNHNVERFTSTIHRHPGSPLYYAPVLVWGLFPWSGLLLPAFAEISPRRSKVELFVLSWFLLPLAFFSAAGSKLPGYILPCLPPAALLMGRAAVALSDSDREHRRWAGARAVALVGVILGSLVAAAPALLLHIQEPGWMLMVPSALWALIVVLSVSRWLARDPSSAFRLLRVGAAGFLLLLTTAVPAILARRESGRNLFLPARGREVMVWGAWRTAWMAGYFYNDGNVRPISGLGEVLEAAAKSPALVLVGPGEQRALETHDAVRVLTLATGPRSNALVRVQLR